MGSGPIRLIITTFPTKQVTRNLIFLAHLFLIIWSRNMVFKGFFTFTCVICAYVGRYRLSYVWLRVIRQYMNIYANISQHWTVLQGPRNTFKNYSLSLLSYNFYNNLLNIKVQFHIFRHLFHVLSGPSSSACHVWVCHPCSYSSVLWSPGSEDIEAVPGPPPSWTYSASNIRNTPGTCCGSSTFFSSTLFFCS